MALVVNSLFFFFFKQKTAYEVRISDWSSDVCSSDLVGVLDQDRVLRGIEVGLQRIVGIDAGGIDVGQGARQLRGVQLDEFEGFREIGRASCRERVCQYV